ncbi:fused MFS/spermidine synthase [Nocardioides sp. GCM10027113]|uniref:fused MFS/spermidine synthase n=1 Tax=unclassified Nocardioides TaxID=2615069 RepID=UPI0036213368
MRTGRGTTMLFLVTAFLGAALLFVVQPLVAKLLLPSYGGSATVWSTASLFFQVVLLAAYLWAHWSTRRWGHRRQPGVQLALLLAPVLVLPLALPAGAQPGPDAEPALWLLRTLALMVGLPFAVVACTGPVIQRWYAWVGDRGEDPYFLFAASNLGSFVGLLAYPLVVERWLSLGAQRLAWSLGFAAYAVLMTVCALVTIRAGREPELVRLEVTPAPGGRRILSWGLLAFVPSSLMLGVTAHLSTDLSPVPLLWVVPLAIYLATFVAAFARSSRTQPVWAGWLAVGLGGAALLTAGPGTLAVAAVVNVALVGAAGYAAHGRLAADRPAADHLTLFYVVVAAGGAAGGLLNGLVAPVVFDQVWEYPLVLAVLPLLLLGTRVRLPVLRLLHPLAATGLMVALAAWTSQLQLDGAVDRMRSFYGAYKVVDDADSRTLVHGTTVHGLQFRGDRAERALPTTYYASRGSCADLFRVMRATGDRLDEVGIVGLGVGTMASYGEAGERFTFFEIDAEVAATAQDALQFSFLADSDADVEVVIGDGRLALADQPRGTYDLLVLDAFSSDSIPVHLLTREAVEEYAEAMAPDGVLLVHISNRFFDLEPVLASAAAELGWTASVGTSRADTPGAKPSTWVALTPDFEVTRMLRGQAEWRPAGEERVRWTDDYASVLSVLQ